MISCKDCVYSYPSIEGRKRCELHGTYETDPIVDDSHYCSYGSTKRGIFMNDEYVKKYSWHKIKVDTSDFPKDLSKYYLYENRYGQIFKGVFRIVGNDKFFETHVYEKTHGDIYLRYKLCDCTRWKIIEPQESE